MESDQIYGPGVCTERGTHGEDPLQGQRAFPGPLIGSRVVAVRGGGDNDTTNRPTHLQRCRASTS